jgi:hypothetical protein
MCTMYDRPKGTVSSYVRVYYVEQGRGTIDYVANGHLKYFFKVRNDTLVGKVDCSSKTDEAANCKVLHFCDWQLLTS